MPETEPLRQRYVLDLSEGQASLRQIAQEMQSFDRRAIAGMDEVQQKASAAFRQFATEALGQVDRIRAKMSGLQALGPEAARATASMTKEILGDVEQLATKARAEIEAIGTRRQLGLIDSSAAKRQIDAVRAEVDTLVREVAHGLGDVGPEAAGALSAAIGGIEQAAKKAGGQVDRLEKEMSGSWRRFSRTADREIGVVEASLRGLGSVGERSAERQAQLAARIIRQTERLAQRARAEIETLQRKQTLGLVDPRTGEREIAQIRSRIQGLVRSVSQGVGEVGPNAARRLTNALDAVGLASRQSARDVEAGSGRMARSLDYVHRGLMQIKILIATVATGFIFRSALQGLIGLNAQLEQSRIAFTRLLGSAAAADKMLRDLERFAEDTPFEMQGLIDSARQLLNYGFAAEEVIPMLRAVGDAGAAMGERSGEAIASIIRALGQMQQRTKVSAEEMQQLAEAGVPAWEILAQKMGKSVAEVQKAVQQGLIPAAKAIPAIIEGINDRVGGMMDDQSASFRGMLSTVQDMARTAMRESGTGLFEDLKNDLKDFKEQIEDLRRSGELSAWTSRISLALREGYRTIKEMARALYEWGPAIMTAAKWLAVTTTAIGAYTAGAKLGAVATGVWGGAVKAFQGTLVLLSAAFRIVQTRSLEAAKGIRLFDAATKGSVVGAIASVILTAATAWFLFRKRTDEATTGIRHIREEVDLLKRNLKEAQGASLWMEFVGAKARAASLAAEATAAQQQAEALQRASVNAPGFTGTLEEFVSIRDNDPLRKLRRKLGLPEGGLIPTTVTVSVEGMPEITTVEEAVAALTEKTAEYEEKWLGATKLTVEGAKAAARGAKDLGFQIERLRSQSESLTNQAGLLPKDSPQRKQLEEQLKGINAELARLEGEYQRLQNLGKNTDITPAIDSEKVAQAQQQAGELADKIRLAAEQAKALRGSHEEIRDVMQQVYDLEEKITSLREEANAEGVKGSPIADRLEAEARSLEEQKADLEGQIQQFTEYRRAIEEIAAGLSDVVLSLTIEADARFDKDTFRKAVTAELSDLQKEFQQRSAAITADLRLGRLNDEQARASLRALQTEMQTRLERILAAFRDTVPPEVEGVVAAVNEAIEGLGDVPLTGLERAKAQLTEIRTAFERGEAKARLEFELGVIGEEDLNRQMKELATTAERDLKDAFAGLPPELRNNAELMRAFLELLKAVRQEARYINVALRQQALDLEKAARGYDAVARSVGFLREVADSFGLINDEIRGALSALEDFIGGFAGLRQAEANLKRAEEAIEAAAEALKKAQTGEQEAQATEDMAQAQADKFAASLEQAFAAAGIAAAIFSFTKSVGDFFIGLRKDSAERRKEHKEYIAELGRLRAALISATAAWNRSIDEAMQGGTVGADASMRDLLTAKELVEELWKMLEGADFGEGRGQGRGAGRELSDEQEIRAREILAMLESLGIGALDGLMAQFEALLAEFEKQGKGFEEALFALFTGLFGQDPDGRGRGEAPEQLIPGLDEVIDRLIDMIGQKSLSIEGALSYLSDIQRFLGIEGQKAFQMFVDFLRKLDLGPVLEEKLKELEGINVETEEGREALTAWVASIKEMGLEGMAELFATLTPEQIDQLLEAFLGFSEEGEKAAHSLQAAADRLSLGSRYLERLGLTADDLRKLFLRELDEDVPEPVRSRVEGMDLSTETGRDDLDRFTEEVMRSILAGTTEEDFGLSEEEALRLVESLTSLEEAVREAADTFRTADDKLSMATSFAERLNLSPNDLRDYYRGALGDDVPEGIRKRLGHMDLSDEAGRDELRLLIDDLMQALLAGTTMEAFGLTEEQAQALLEALTSLEAAALAAADSLSRASEEFGLAQRFSERLGMTADDLRKLYLDSLGEDAPEPVRRRLERMDLTTPEGQSDLGGFVEDLMRSILAGTTEQAFGLTKEQALQLLDALTGLESALNVAAATFSDAAGRFDFAGRYADRLGLSRDDLRDMLVEDLESTEVPISGALLEELRALNLATEAGQASLEALITRVLNSILLGTTQADFGMTEEDAKALVAALEGLRTDTGAETSRSVQYLRTITEFEGNEMLLILDEMAYRLGQLVRGVDYLATLMEQSLGVVTPPEERPNLNVTVRESSRDAAGAGDAREVLQSILSEVKALREKVSAIHDLILLAQAAGEPMARQETTPHTRPDLPDQQPEEPASRLDPGARPEEGLQPEPQPHPQLPTPEVTVHPPEVNVDAPKAPELQVNVPAAAAPELTLPRLEVPEIVVPPEAEAILSALARHRQETAPWSGTGPAVPPAHIEKHFPIVVNEASDIRTIMREIEKQIVSKTRRGFPGQFYK